MVETKGTEINENFFQLRAEFGQGIFQWTKIFFPA